MFFFIDVPSVKNIVARRVVHQVVPRLLKYSSKIVWLKISSNFLKNRYQFLYGISTNFWEKMIPTLEFQFIGYIEC